MERYRTYFKWAGGLAIAYAGLLLASWLVMAVSLGPGIYEVAAPTAGKLFEIYGSPGAAWAVQLEVVAWFLLAAALPAFALYLARRTPGLAWGGLGVGALAMVVSLVGYLLEGMAYRLGAGGGAPLFALLPPGDAVLLFNMMAEALALPMTFATYAWFLVWALAFFRDGSRLGRFAAFAFLLTFIFFLISLAGFTLQAPLLANGGILFQTLTQAAAFALAGAAVGTFRELK
jgi:hypothetical protein